jgi:hypothetical protein
LDNYKNDNLCSYVEKDKFSIAVHSSGENSFQFVPTDVTIRQQDVADIKRQA